MGPDKDSVTEDIMKEFDSNDDKKITMDEFVNGMTKWLDESKGAVTKRYHSIKSLKDLYQVTYLLCYSSTSTLTFRCSCVNFGFHLVELTRIIRHRLSDLGFKRKGKNGK